MHATGPVKNVRVALVATVANYITYSMWTLANKWQFISQDHGGFGIKTPLVITAIQMLIAGLAAYIAIYVFGIQRPTQPLLTKQVIRERILPLGFSRAIDIGCGNFALSLVTVAVQQVIKSTLPVFVSILSVFVLNKMLSREAWVTLIPIVMGTVLATLGDVHFSGLGVTLAIISCFGRAFKAVLNARILHATADSLQPLQILLLEAPTTGLLILLPCIASEWKTIHTTWPAIQAALPFNIFCGLLMFFNQATYITIIDHTSATSCQVLMNVKMLLLILVSIQIFHTHISGVNYFGLALAVGGCFWYAKVLGTKPKPREHSV